MCNEQSSFLSWSNLREQAHTQTRRDLRGRLENNPCCC